MSNLKPESISYGVSDILIDINIQPKKFTCGEKDIMPHLPKGLLFNYDSTLSYNFRITVEKMFVKIKGYYTNEDELCKKVTSAIDDPAQYMKLRDPEYLLGQIEKMFDTQEKYKLEMDKIKTDLDKYKLAHEKFLTAFLAMQNAGMFSDATPVDPKIIDKVISIKTENPAYKKEQITDLLEKEGLEVSEDEVFLILAVYFNEYE